MAQLLKDSFLDLERHRQMLDDNVAKIRKSLQHWRNWEVEYEGLKEEVLAITPSASQEQLVAIGRNYERDLLKQAELEDILGVKISRSADQVTNILQRRIDYVEQNVKTLEKQLDVAEKKLTAATIISRPDVMNEEGLPMTEIFEELDEEGNVISSRTSNPGSSKSQLLEVLQKAGMKDLPDQAQKEQIEQPKIRNGSTELSPGNDGKSEVDAARPQKKVVKFTEDTKSGPEKKRSATAKRIEDIIELSKKQEYGAPVIPDNEAPQDAQLRKDMLQYGMSEIGTVVAELDLEENADYDDDDDIDDDESTSTDDEDNYGRSKRQIVDEKLRQRMIELEERLGVRMMENVGPKAEVGVVQDRSGIVKINQENNLQRSAEPDSEEPVAKPRKEIKRGVRFAEELDVQEVPKPVPAASIAKSKDHNTAGRPVRDIVERTVPAQGAMIEEAPPHRVSKFKAARTGKQSSSALLTPSLPPTFTEASRTRIVPTGPPGKPLADGVVERETPTTAPLEPDELDPSLLQQEVATDYHRMRNRLIQRQGGFMKREEDETGIIPLTEEEGGPKKISRFMAARLARG